MSELHGAQEVDSTGCTGGGHTDRCGDGHDRVSKCGEEGRYPIIELKNGESMLVIPRQQVCREQRERYL
jgi:hypothetical protein